MEIYAAIHLPMLHYFICIHMEMFHVCFTYVIGPDEINLVLLNVNYYEENSS